MIEFQKKDVEPAVRLMVGNLPYAVDRESFLGAFAQHGTVTDGYLSPAKSPDKNNAGWGIVTLDETAARRVLTETILIGGRVARIKPAKPKNA